MPAPPALDLAGRQADRDLEGLYALVRGATSGIGRAVAGQLAEQGAEVLMHGRDAVRGGTVVDSIAAGGGKARFVAADLTRPAELGGLAEQAGQVDILVNNAGMAWFGPTAELGVAAFDQLFTANVRPTYFLTAALAPQMAARGSGSIVNVGSMAGEIGMPGGAAYSATKAALDAMTGSWAAEFSPAGVRINTVASGPVYTAIQPAEVTEAVGATTIMARAPGQLRHRRGHLRRRRPCRHLSKRPQTPLAACSRSRAGGFTRLARVPAPGYRGRSRPGTARSSG